MRRILSVDISGACNLRCPSCPRGRKEIGGSSGFMDLEMFKRIVDKATKEFDISYLYFQLWGEPTLNDDFGAMMDYCDDCNIPFRISTNLQSNKVDVLEKALVLDADLIWISCSGWSQETYGVTHKSDFENFLKNAIWLATTKKRLKGSTKLIIRWHRYKHNCHEEKLARAFAKKYGYKFEALIAWYLPLQSVLLRKEDEITKLLLIPIDEGLELVSGMKEATGCSEYDVTYVDTSGQVKLCCMTYNITLGDFFTASDEIFNEQRFTHKFCEICQKARLFKYMARTDYRLLLIAARNCNSFDVKLRIYFEMLLYFFVGLGRKLPISGTLRDNIGMWIKHLT